MNPRIPEPLMAIVRRAYPPSEPLGADGAVRTRQLGELVRNAQPQLEPKWKHLISEVHKQWPARILWNNTYLVLEPSFRLRVYASSPPADIPKDPRIHDLALVIMVSAIAPLHHLHITLERMEVQNGKEKHLPSMLLHARDQWPASVRDDAWQLEELTMAAMGTSQIPLELLQTKVPFGEATSEEGNERTLGEYFFGTHWW